MSLPMSGSSTADILIVDDTPANLQLLTKILSDHGYRVRPVPCGDMALSAAQLQPPDLILLDIKMPMMDGYQVCAKLKEEAITREIPIIFISALDATQDKIKAFQAGGLDYITKPFQVEEVVARVETHLTMRKLRQQLQDANSKMARELALAGEVQSSFLKHQLPEINAWQMTVTLQPSQETSGDFYDIRQLSNGRIGLLVADVVDKGAGAALFMALSWALFRTCAVEFPSQPELVLSAVNNRILENTNTNQYLTAFYGIVDPKTGALAYCNAGHCPPFLFHHQAKTDPIQLLRTGVPLGIFDDQTWERGSVQLELGDVLILYSDGVTEAKNEVHDFYGEERLVKVVGESVRKSAKEIHNSIIESLQDFIGEAIQSDDIVLSVVMRESGS